MDIGATENTSPPESRYHFVRQFCRGDIEVFFTEWADIEPIFKSLLERSITSVEELIEWIADRSDLLAHLDQAAGGLQDKTLRNTEDQTAKSDYEKFINTVQTEAESKTDLLSRKLAESPYFADLPGERYEVLRRSVKNDIEIFRQENVPLNAHDQELCLEYSERCGSILVSFEGQELRTEQVVKLLKEPDSKLRERAWRAMYSRWLQEKAGFDGLYNRMLATRCKIAANAGFADFRDYSFKSLERFDYTPADCETFHRSIEELVVPVCGQFAAERKAALKTATLRPWDTSGDPHGRPALRPFSETSQLIDGAVRMLNRVHPELGQQLSLMNERGEMDLSTRKGKANGAYMRSYPVTQRPFVFGNVVGSADDVQTLLHEFGHCLQTLQLPGETLYEYIFPGMEVSEVFSMGMELLALDKLDEFYKGEDLRRAKRDHLIQIIEYFPWFAQVDAFQHWVYTHQEHSIEERDAQWAALTARFSPHVDRTGLEQEQFVRWHRQSHIFTSPFYYIEYAIAQLGALQLWSNYETAPAAALNDYFTGLRLGGSRTVPETFAACGIKFDFSPGTLKPIVQELQRKIQTLS
jgi:oligoendopeptidase F